MFHSITRTAFAVTAALLVASSFVGAPVVAAGAGSGLDTLSTDGGSAGDALDDGEETDDSDGDDGAQSDDGEDGAPEDEDGGSDGEDGQADDDGTERGDAESDADEDGDDTDDTEKADDDDGADDDGTDGDGTDDDRTDEDGDRHSTYRTTTAMEEVAEEMEETAEELEETSDGLEESTDDLAETTEETAAGVEETAGGSTHEVDTLGRFAIGGLSLLDLVGPLDLDASEGDPATRTDAGDADRGPDGEHGPAPAESLEVRSAERPTADAGDADDEEDGSPAPSDPGGAVVGFGAVATAAALRGRPVVPGGRAASGGWLSALLERVRPFVLPLRYSRYDDSDPLEHDARERVYEIVNETPGSYLSAVSQEADLPLSTTRHHIKVLEREDLVTGAKIHGKRRFYPAYAEGVELAAALNDDSTATIIQAIARIGAASVSDLADELGRDPSTVSHHLQRLEADGIVTRERDGRAVVNRLSAEARTALEPESTPEAGEASELVAGGAD